MWWEAIFLILAGLALALVLAVLYGKFWWQAGTRELSERLERRCWLSAVQ